jgi:hypothetical protein
MGRGPAIDWLPILTGKPSALFEPSDFDAAMRELDEYLKPHVEKQEKQKPVDNDSVVL